MRSSNTIIQIIFAAPRVIDSDFEEEIKVLTHSPKRISVVKMRQRPAHLILLPQVQTKKNQVKRDKRGESVFGSADGYWLQAIGPQRPELTLFPSRKSFSGLLDSGVDVSVTTANQWPST